MTIYRATVLDTPENPFTGGRLRSDQDAGILVQDGAIRARGSFADVERDHSGEDVVDLRGGVLLPGFVDTHVHYPQLRVIGGIGMPLLDWLDRCALPEEARLADQAYARAVASEFVHGLVAAGTTSALVFGSHFASAVDSLFAEAGRVGLRVTAGLVVGDRILRSDLLTTPERAHEEGQGLATRWHRQGRLRYAVTPRFSLFASPELLESCASLAKDVDGAWFTSHINENVAEIEQVARQHRLAIDYLDTYDRYGLVGRQSVFAHNVHATDRELAVLGAQQAAVAHCPTSNAALASGLFPLKRHVEYDIRVALGSDVGAGTGLSLLKEGLQAYFIQQLQQDSGVALTAAHLLYLATSAGADALGLDDVGDLSVGRQFDAVWVRPPVGSTLDTALEHAQDPDDALAKVFALGGVADTAGVWVGGTRLLG
jgi:guanine deaminase